MAGSDGVHAGLAGTDTDDFLDVGDEDLAVADAAGLGRLANGFDGTFDGIVAEHDLDLYLGQEVDDIFGAAIEFGVAFLPAKTLGLGDGDTLQSGLLKRFLHFVQLEWLDDRFDLFHVESGLHCQRDGLCTPLAPPSSTKRANSRSLATVSGDSDAMPHPRANSRHPLHWMRHRRPKPVHSSSIRLRRNWAD